MAYLCRPGKEPHRLDWDTHQIISENRECFAHQWRATPSGSIDCRWITKVGSAQILLARGFHHIIGAALAIRGTLLRGCPPFLYRKGQAPRGRPRGEGGGKARPRASAGTRPARRGASRARPSPTPQGNSPSRRHGCRRGKGRGEARSRPPGVAAVAPAHACPSRPSPSGRGNAEDVPCGQGRNGQVPPFFAV